MTSQDLDVLDETDCYLMLRSRTLGRVGVHIADDLAIFPVYYAMSGHDVVFRTSPGTKLNAAVLGTRVVFEVDSGGTFHPVSFQQDNLGIYHEAVFVDDVGQVMVRPQLLKDLTAFARQWDKNLKEQGLGKAARAEARRRTAAG